MATIKSINPFNNKVLQEYKEHDQAALETILKHSQAAFKNWKNTSFEERSRCMKNAAGYLMKHKRELGELISLEMGKPIVQSISEIEKCAVTCEYYAERAPEFLQDEIIPSDASKSFVSYEPLGTILAVMPWNFPFWQVFRFAAPSIMAGNVALLKHSSNVPQCSLAIEKVFKESGFPDHVFQTLLIGSSKVSSLIQHEIIKATTLTGSEKAGSEVAMESAKNIKKSVLELGGSDCFIVLKDANLEKTAEIAVKSRMINTGQSCIAAKRFILVEEIYDKFLTLMMEHMAALKMGDPLEEGTEIGPMAREDLAIEILRQVENSVKKGAKILWGGGRPSIPGAFVNPVILGNIHPGMPAYEEEFFGPVALVFKAKDETDAVRIANDSRFGLGGSIWTGNVEKGTSLARQIESGCVFVNGMVKSDARLPFGGIKKSGYGRELSYIGIREFVNVKTIWVG